MDNTIVTEAGVFLRKTTDGRIMILGALPEGCFDSDEIKHGEVWAGLLTLTGKRFKAPVQIPYSRV